MYAMFGADKNDIWQQTVINHPSRDSVIMSTLRLTQHRKINTDKSITGRIYKKMFWIGNLSKLIDFSMKNAIHVIRNNIDIASINI